MDDFSFIRTSTPNAITVRLIASTPDDVLESILVNYVQAYWKKQRTRPNTLPLILELHYVAFRVEREILNEGFNQLLFNSPGLAKLAAQAFKRMGMKEAAHLAQRARRLYEAVRPRLEAAHADGTIEAFMGTYDGARFKVLDLVYAASKVTFRSQRLGFIRSHSEKCVHPGETG